MRRIGRLDLDQVADPFRDYIALNFLDLDLYDGALVDPTSH
jgi:hypothetical protein